MECELAVMLRGELLHTNSQPDKLARKHYAIVVLRLLLYRRILVQGEVVDETGRVRKRFSGWERLADAVRESLLPIDQSADQSADQAQNKDD